MNRGIYLVALGVGLNLSLAAVADARTQSAVLGNPSPPTSSSPCIGSSNGAVTNLCADGTGQKGWIMPLTLDTSGNKAPAISAVGFIVSTDGPTTCTGYIVNPDGTIYDTTTTLSWISASTQSPQTKSVPLGKTYVVGCYFGGGTRINSITYTP